VPCMLMGALFGRMGGQLLHEVFPDETIASPGVYALVGSASLLAGFTHMTIAIVVLMVEASSDLNLVAPLMLGIITANLVSARINHHGYDEVLILKKGVPYLDAELPHEMDSKGVVARDICDFLPDEAILKPSSTLSEVDKALTCMEFLDFPVLDDGICVGVTTRARLEAAFEARSEQLMAAGRITLEEIPQMAEMARQASPQDDDFTMQDPCRQTSNSSYTYDSKGENRGDQAPERFTSKRENQAPGMSLVIKDMFSRNRANSQVVPGAQPLLHVHRIMDRAPHLLLEDMPIARFYNLFVKAGCHSAVVVDSHGGFVGILTREHLITETRDAHRPTKNQLKVGRSTSYSRKATPGSEAVANGAIVQGDTTGRAPSLNSGFSAGTTILAAEPSEEVVRLRNRVKELEQKLQVSRKSSKATTIEDVPQRMTSASL